MTNQTNVAAVVLAAGSSSRMKRSNKLLESLGEQPILHHVLNAVINSRVQQCVLVTGHDANQVANSVAQFSLDIVHNPNHDLGISSSIKVGLAQVGEEYDAVLIVLGDMPDVSSELIDALVSSFNLALGAEICVPTFNGKRGNPVLWSNRFFPSLATIEGDLGGKQIIGQFEKYVYECELPSSAIHADIDTASQLALRRVKEST